MRLRTWATAGGAALGLAGLGLLAGSFVPRPLPVHTPLAGDAYGVAPQLPQLESLPDIEVTFLRCGVAVIPRAIAARGAFAPAMCPIAHSAVLIRHPRATFLYDTGLCSDIRRYLAPMPPLFQATLGRFTLEMPLAAHLERLNLSPRDLDFVLLSHLHWDHVSGLPDLPGVRLLVNRVEYAAALHGRPAPFQRDLVWKLLGDHSLELFDCDGPPCAGFHSSHDLLGDGSLQLITLPGHTAGNTGLLITRSNGSRLFLLGDAAWVAENYQQPTTMHPLMWLLVTGDDATGRQTLIELHRFARRAPEVPLIAMHDAEMQERVMRAERQAAPAAR